jgi:hypothetical protein
MPVFGVGDTHLGVEAKSTNSFIGHASITQ